MNETWLDRTIEFVAPRWALARARARAATSVLKRHYEAAAKTRRTGGWSRGSGDVNQIVGGALERVRDHARDLVRNNGHAESAVGTIEDHVVGWGIMAKPAEPDQAARDAWKAWAESTDCDADGRHDFYGLQALVTRTVVESGECLVRRRFRLPEDDLALPMQIQVLDPDYLDTLRSNERTPAGGRIVNGVEFDAIGRRVAYWLFPEHPKSAFGFTATSRRVPAENVLHVYRQRRPGQVRGISWFAPVILKMKDWDEYDDAQLMKQKVSALLAAIVTDPDGTSAPLGTADDTDDPYTDTIEPGAVIQAPPGRTVEVVQPPRVGEFAVYAEVTLRAIATGLGVTYEDLTGDYSDLPFSAARMSRLRHYDRVHGWRWRMLIPQLCDPVWMWAMEAAAIMGQVRRIQRAQWTAPPMPFIDPDKEGLAYQRNVRGGLMSHSEALRERGYDPDEVRRELRADFDELDRLNLVLDIDPRYMTQAGQYQQPATVEEDT